MKAIIISILLFLFILTARSQQEMSHKLNIKALYSNIPNQFLYQTVGMSKIGYPKVEISYGFSERMSVGAFAGTLITKAPSRKGNKKICYYSPNFGVSVNRILIPRLFRSFDANLYGNARVGAYLDSGWAYSVGKGMMGSVGLGSAIKIWGPLAFIVEAGMGLGINDYWGPTINLGLSVNFSFFDE